MRQEELVLALSARGGEADLWVVYVEDRYETLLGAAVTLTAHAAFWTRGEAYSFAHAHHQERPWDQCHVFRLHADTAWAASTTRRELEFETVFDRAGAVRQILVTAEAVSRLLQD